ncbi:nose resistant to fluoxetine protein 6 [Galendromus occidentalis]|uniref:Nose resistant to fluoxetine protein 6 n=1 Tax=Galendromus occidentalis TaxID=34638 RepID=A0AAJ6QMP9_9ACAR|nr:nose resistant to fluoxetine protein 6 [Galendromus occidentalis]
MMADAFVKPPTGILSGTFSFVSNYDQCLKIPEFDLDDIENVLQKYPRLPSKVKGAYCSFKLRLKRNKYFKRPENETLSEFQENMKKEEHKMDDVYKLQPEFPGYVGLCVPSPCSKVSFENLGLAMKNILLKYIKPNREKFPILVGIDAVSCHQADDLPPASFGTRFISGIFILLAIIVLIGTLADVVFCLKQKRDHISKDEAKHSYDFALEGNFSQMLRSCSAVVSFRQLMDTRVPTHTVKCLYGVKFFAIVWLIMGNTGQLRAGNMTTNMKEMEKTLQTMTTQFVLNKDLAVDTLLVVSGVLSAFGLSKRNGVGHVLRYSGHRLMKTVPMYYLLLWFLICCFARMGAGPTWDIESQRYLSKCGTTWWANMAFINNFLKVENQCMPHSWLVAYLMQGLIVAVIATFSWKKMENVTHFVLGVLVVTTMVIDFVLNLTNNLGPTTLLREYRLGSKNDYMSIVGMQIYSRGGPFFIGLIIGFIFHQKMNSKGTFSKLGRLATTLLWLMILTVVIVTMNATFDWNRGASYPSNSVSAVYDACHRVVFALGTGLLIMLCHAKKGGIVNMLLSWPGFIPVGKLWLLIYLVHPFVIFHSNGTLRAPVYYTKKQLFSEILWNLVISIVVSVVLHILLVAPFQAIERFFYDTFIEPSDESDFSILYLRYTNLKKDVETGSSNQSSPSARKDREELPEPYDKHQRDYPNGEDTTDKSDEKV